MNRRRLATAVGAASAAMAALLLGAAQPAGALRQGGSADELFALGGNNFAGQLGDGTTTSRSAPQAVALPAGVVATEISAGHDHSLALGSDGKAYAWGFNADGALGDGTTTNRLAPVQVALPSGVIAKAVSAGSYVFSLAVGDDGRVYAWGNNQSGQLGDGTSDGTQTPHPTPEPVALPGGVAATAVSAGLSHSLALGADGNVYAWGDNNAGELGDGTTTRHLTPELIRLPGGVSARAVSAGANFSLAVGSDGRVYAWGDNDVGQLGGGAADPSPHPTPAPVALPVGVTVTAVSAGADSSFALGSDGTVYAWGANRLGELGDGTAVPHPAPEAIALAAGVTATAVSAGDGFSLAAGSDGLVYGWGDNHQGMLGDGTTISHRTPEAIVLPDGLAAAAVSADGTFSLALGRVAAPRFFRFAPPATATVGSTLDYTFSATGRPTFALSAGAPAWLSIDPSTGELTGTVPAGIKSSSYSVTATNGLGSVTAGPFTLTIAAAPVHVSGTVTVSGVGTPSGTIVDACVAGGSVCNTTSTDGSGGFTVLAPPDSAVTLTAFPPTAGVEARSTTVDVGENDVQGIAIVVPRVVGLNGVSFPSGALSSGNGSVVLQWAQAAQTNVTGCANGFATLSVVARNESTDGWDFNVYALAESAPGSGIYTGTLPPQYPLHGLTEIRSEVFCQPGVALRSLQRRTEVSALEVLEVIHEHAPQLLDLLSLKAAVKDAAKHLGKPTCSTEKQEYKDELSLSVGLDVAPLVEAAIPEIEAVVIAAFAETGPLDLLVSALTPVAVNYMAGKLVDAAVEAFVDSAYGDCPPPDGPTVDGLIDPSGTVVDTNGSPVAGATATILRSDLQAGPFAPVDVTQPGIEPPVNPETTAADGAFHWDVRAGFYEVQASKPGCTVPGQPGQATATAGPYPVPPPQVGLTVTLACPDEPRAPQPAVSSLSADTGSPAGGTALLLQGSGFTPQSAVSFGAARAASVTYLSPQALSVVSPAGSGTVDVVVSTQGGASATSAADRFFYGTAPTVSGLSATSGPLEGGTALTVSGSGFTGASVVGFGGTPGRDLRVVSDRELVVTSPAGQAAGSVDVVVVTPAGGSSPVRFSYLAPAPAGPPAAPASPPSPPATTPPGPPAAAPSPADTLPPRPGAPLGGRIRNGTLVLRWQPASDNVGVDHYRLYLNGTPIDTLPGTATSARLRAFERHRRSVYSLRVFDAAGNESRPVVLLGVSPNTRPGSTPEHIPGWAWRLLAWQERGEHGARPHTPRPLRPWYAAWKDWRIHPFRLGP